MEKSDYVPVYVNKIKKAKGTCPICKTKYKFRNTMDGEDNYVFGCPNKDCRYYCERVGFIKKHKKDDSGKKKTYSEDGTYHQLIKGKWVEKRDENHKPGLKRSELRPNFKEEGMKDEEYERTNPKEQEEDLMRFSKKIMEELD